MAYILALDQGTTSSRCVLFDQDLQLIDFSQQAFEQHFRAFQLAYDGGKLLIHIVKHLCDFDSS